LCHRR